MMDNLRSHVAIHHGDQDDLVDGFIAFRLLVADWKKIKPVDKKI